MAPDGDPGLMVIFRSAPDVHDHLTKAEESTFRSYLGEKINKMGGITYS